jgi:hypothetical protein
MIKKLINEPYAPKVGGSPQVGARGSNDESGFHDNFSDQFVLV